MHLEFCLPISIVIGTLVYLTFAVFARFSARGHSSLPIICGLPLSLKLIFPYHFVSSLVISAPELGSGIFLGFTLVALAISFLSWIFLFSPLLRLPGLSNFSETIIFALFAFGGGLLPLFNPNVLLLFVALELVSLSGAALVAVDRKTLRSTEAGIRYLVLGGIPAAIFLAGSFTGLATTGSTTLGWIGGLTLFSLAGKIFTGGLGIIIFYKLGLAPLHFWVVDIYAGAPAVSAAFLSTILKFLIGAAALVLYLESTFVYTDPVFLEGWTLVLGGCIIISWLVGGLGGLGQSQISRLLAYSSIGHTAWFSACFLDPINSFLPLAYLFFYSLGTLGLWALGILAGSRRSKRNFNSSLAANPYLADFSGFQVVAPASSLMLGVFFFSAAGIPPLGGFLLKLGVLENLIGGGWLAWAACGALASLIPAAFYIGVISTVAHGGGRGARSKAFIHISAGILRTPFSMGIVLTAASWVLVSFIWLGLM